MTYNWQFPEWPHFIYSSTLFQPSLIALAEKTGRMSGWYDGFSEDNRENAMIQIMVEEAIKTSEIEGEYLHRKEVRSSIRNHLGLNVPPEKISDRRATGVASLMVENRTHFFDPLTEADLFRWHDLLLGGQKHYPPLLSLSFAIELARKKYYDTLKMAQRSLEINDWIGYFLQTLLEAQIEAEKHVYFSLQKAKLFGRISEDVNPRQLKVLQYLLKEGPHHLKKINASKYAALTKISKATATRDLQHLIHIQALKKEEGGGRNTRYSVHLSTHNGTEDY